MASPEGEGGAENFLVTGRVLGVHIEDRFIEKGSVNAARLGYSEYATIESAWAIRQPS
jgi:hypothetical protein